MRKEAKENLKRAKEISKVYYDRRLKPLILDPGEFVYVLHGTIRSGSKKFADQYDGPYEVIRKISDTDYEIKIGRKNQILHVNRLKRAHLIPCDTLANQAGRGGSIRIIK